MSQSRQDEISDLINTHLRRKFELEKRAARQGDNVDPAVTMEIQDIMAKVVALESELAGLGEAPTAPAFDTLSERDRQYQIALHWAEDGRRGSLSRFDLSGRDLRTVDLAGAKLGLVNLSQAKLRYAKLNEADLRLANLHESDLSRVDLSGADLREANLSEANLRGAILRGAILFGVDLRGANLSGAILFGAGYNAATRWPGGFNPLDHSLVRVDD